VLGLGKTLGGDTARAADSDGPKRYSIPYEVCSAVKARRKEREGTFIITAFVFWSNCCAYCTAARYFPTYQEVAGHRPLIGSRA